MLPSDSAQMSPMASSLNQLQQLQQTDPTEFKAIMLSIASTLSTDAQNATGSRAQALSNLSSQFSQSAQTGQMPNLQPTGQQQGVSGHHHHHHGGGTLIKAPAQRPALEHLLAPVHRQATKISLQSTWRRSFRRLCSSRVNRRLRDGKSQLRVYLGPVLRRRHGFADQFQVLALPLCQF